MKKYMISLVKMKLEKPPRLFIRMMPISRNRKMSLENSFKLVY